MRTHAQIALLKSHKLTFCLKHFIIRCGKNDPSPLPDFMQLMREFILLELAKVPDITEVRNNNSLRKSKA